MNVVLVGFATVPMLLHRPTVRVRTLCDPTCVTLGGGHLYLKLDIILEKRLRVQKTCKIGKKGVFFGHIDKFWKGHAWRTNYIKKKLKKKKKSMQKHVFIGSIFTPENKRVCFWSYWQILERTWGGVGNRMQKHVFIGSIFIPENKRVCFWSYWQILERTWQTN